MRVFLTGGTDLSTVTIPAWPFLGALAENTNQTWKKRRSFICSIQVTRSNQHRRAYKKEWLFGILLLRRKKIDILLDFHRTVHLLTTVNIGITVCYNEKTILIVQKSILRSVHQKRHRFMFQIVHTKHQHDHLHKHQEQKCTSLRRSFTGGLNRFVAPGKF